MGPRNKHFHTAQELREIYRGNLLRVRNLLMEGMRYDEIAVCIGIAHRTVKKYALDLCALYGVRRSNGKLKYVELAVAVFKAGHCNCARCSAARGSFAGLPESASEVSGSNYVAESARNGGRVQCIR